MLAAPWLKWPSGRTLAVVKLLFTVSSRLSVQLASACLLALLLRMTTLVGPLTVTS